MSGSQHSTAWSPFGNQEREHGHFDCEVPEQTSCILPPSPRWQTPADSMDTCLSQLWWAADNQIQASPTSGQTWEELVPQEQPSAALSLQGSPFHSYANLCAVDQSYANPLSLHPELEPSCMFGGMENGWSPTTPALFSDLSMASAPSPAVLGSYWAPELSGRSEERTSLVMPTFATGSEHANDPLGGHGTDGTQREPPNWMIRASPGPGPSRMEHSHPSVLGVGQELQLHTGVDQSGVMRRDFPVGRQVASGDLGPEDAVTTSYTSGECPAGIFFKLAGRTGWCVHWPRRYLTRPTSEHSRDGRVPMVRIWFGVP